MKARVIKAGDIVDIYEYEKPVMYGYQQSIDTAPRREMDLTDEEHYKRKDNLSRARQMIRYYIWTNRTPYMKFVTFTYRDNMQDYWQFLKDWKRFVERMSRKGYKLRYLYVLERQERGAIHVHAVIFNNEYIPQDFLTEVWGHGFVWIIRINHVRNVGAYVSKYLQKDSMQYYGSYAYHLSRNLRKPEELRVDETDVLTLPKLEDELEITHEEVIFDDFTQQFIRYRQGVRRDT